MTVEATRAPVQEASLHVDRWTDLVGGLLERHPRFWIALGNLETRLLSERIEDVTIERPIYITGLARSGSTILLELLSRHPEVATHRYRDFPGVLAPWAWNWFIDRAAAKTHVAQERAHRDRIRVTPESPEAFEEVIWMAFFPGLHESSASTTLDKDTTNTAFEAFYRDHIRKLLLLRGGARYLAKGNYNLTRLAYLAKLFPDARFVVPIRDPVWHIASLIKQHDLFSKEETRDARILSHMRRSGHFEFGLNRRAVDTGAPDAAARILRLWRSGREIEGWAEYWALTHGHLLRTLESDSAIRAAARIVRYEDLCASPAETMADILSHCGLAPRDLPRMAQQIISPPDYYRPSFTDKELDLIHDRTQGTAIRLGYN